MLDNIEREIQEILKKKKKTRCELWNRVRELEMLKSWGIKNTPLEVCMYKCSGYNTRCKDYYTSLTEVQQGITDKEVEERR